jgi:hypothetical protein
MKGRWISMSALLVGAFLAANGAAAAADSTSADAQGPVAPGTAGCNPDPAMQGGMGRMMGDQPAPHGTMRDDGMLHGEGLRHGEGTMHGHGMMHGEDMLGPGTMGDGDSMNMMDMMHACGRMMDRGPMPGLPRLPPGNEKLQLQMQAEMMQKMGEILAKYAARIPDTPNAAH